MRREIINSNTFSKAEIVCLYVCMSVCLYECVTYSLVKFKQKLLAQICDLVAPLVLILTLIYLVTYKKFKTFKTLNQILQPAALYS